VRSRTAPVEVAAANAAAKHWLGVGHLTLLAGLQVFRVGAIANVSLRGSCLIRFTRESK
jgi:hypothetical protein